MTSRRDFLTMAGALAISGRAIGPYAQQARGFRGSRAGESRDVDGVAFRWCPAGRFLMGSPPTEAGHRPDEAQVEVTLTKGFWIGQAEVTQAQWQRIVGAWPDKPPTAQFGIGNDFPMYWVNFPEAEAFCAALTQRARRGGSLPTGWEVRLPTEAQWEYACRAGTTTASAFGERLTTRQANFAGETVDQRALPTGMSRAAGDYPPNAWGIHDMHGNVWEWCRDWYHSRLPGGTDPDVYETRGAPNRDGSYSRVRRGGAWVEPVWACRSACRLRYEPPRRSDHIGFRVVAVEP